MSDPSTPVISAHTGAAVLRLLDANLDRAREGLRVLEDWARFALDRPDLVARFKDLRQRLGRCHEDRFRLARHTATDPAAGLGHPAQAERREPAAVLAANAARVQEALRVLEEFGRQPAPQLAAEAAAIRYLLYDLEVDLLRAGAAVDGEADGGADADAEANAGADGDAEAEGDRRRGLLRSCRLYLITSPGPGLEAALEAALIAGVRLVQYRAKEGCRGADGQPLDDAGRLAEALSLRRLCGRHGALFLVNDRIDLALAVEADGVHLGQGDLPPAVARRLLGPERLIGRSTHALPQLRQALADGCDYVGVGPVHATPSKPGREPVGLDYVRAAAELLGPSRPSGAEPDEALPFFAIGGIDAATLPAVRAAGAGRVAVVRAITAAADPGAAASELLALLQR